MPIGDEGSEVRKRSDKILRFIIRPAVEAFQYKAIRADEIDRPGIITSQVINHVIADDLVVADLTDSNPNVFYELAVRHASRKPVVQILEKSKRLPFDVSNQRTIFFDISDLESVEETKSSIQSQIKEIENSDGDIETPISLAHDLQLIKQSTDSDLRRIYEVLASLSESMFSVSKETSESRSIIAELKHLRAMLMEIGELNYQRGPRPPRRDQSLSLQRFISRAKSKDDLVGYELIDMATLIQMFRDESPIVYDLGVKIIYAKAASGDVSSRISTLFYDLAQKYLFDSYGPNANYVLDYLRAAMVREGYITQSMSAMMDKLMLQYRFEAQGGSDIK